jgi:hypothetical protein
MVAKRDAGMFSSVAMNARKMSACTPSAAQSPVRVAITQRENHITKKQSGK